MIFGSFVCLGFAYMGKIARYETSELAPVAKDTTNYLIEGTKDQIVNLVKQVKGNPNTIVKCPYCGDDNDIDAVYCDHCGVKLRETCICGSENQPGSRYCKKCGREL